MPTPNPYPETDERHRIWDEGYKAGPHDLIEKIGRAEIAKEFPRLFKD